jgi:hypothetical protein
MDDIKRSQESGVRSQNNKEEEEEERRRRKKIPLMLPAPCSSAPHKGRFLILSVKARLGRLGGKVDKEDFIRTIVF